MKTMKVAPWGEGQGDYVLINEEDFNSDVHQPFDAADKPDNVAKKKTYWRDAEGKVGITEKGAELPEGVETISKADFDAADKPE